MDGRIRGFLLLSSFLFFFKIVYVVVAGLSVASFFSFSFHVSSLCGSGCVGPPKDSTTT